MVRQYPAMIFKEPESGYGVVFPDFDGCVTVGDTPEQAHAQAAEALQGHVDLTLEHGDELPEPTALAAVYARCRKEKALVVIVVSVRLPGTGRAKRINITMDEELLDELDQAAARRSVSRSALLAEGARRVIGKD